MNRERRLVLAKNNRFDDSKLKTTVHSFVLSYIINQKNHTREKRNVKQENYNKRWRSGEANQEDIVHRGLMSNPV